MTPLVATKRNCKQEVIKQDPRDLPILCFLPCVLPITFLFFLRSDFFLPTTKKHAVVYNHLFLTVVTKHECMNENKIKSFVAIGNSVVNTTKSFAAIVNICYQRNSCYFGAIAKMTSQCNERFRCNRFYQHAELQYPPKLSAHPPFLTWA